MSSIYTTTSSSPPDMLSTVLVIEDIAKSMTDRTATPPAEPRMM